VRAPAVAHLISRKSKLCIIDAFNSHHSLAVLAIRKGEGKNRSHNITAGPLVHPYKPYTCVCFYQSCYVVGPEGYPDPM